MNHTFPLRPFGPKLGNVSRKRFEPLEKRSFSDRSGSTRLLHIGGKGVIKFPYRRFPREYLVVLASTVDRSIPSHHLSKRKYPNCMKRPYFNGRIALRLFTAVMDTCVSGVSTFIDFVFYHIINLLKSISIFGLGAPAAYIRFRMVLYGYFSV